MTNVDVNNVARGACTQCGCSQFLSGEGAKCAACKHTPIKHKTIDSTTNTRQADTSVDFSQHDSYEFLSNATHLPNFTPFDPNATSPPASSYSQANKLTVSYQGENNTDVRGIGRGRCEEAACDCTSYQKPDTGLKCFTCGHSPVKHISLSSQDSPHHRLSFGASGSHQQVSESIVSAKVNMMPLSPLQANITSPSHQVMTSFRSDPPNAVSVSADNSLIVPSNQPVKITIEINIVPKPV